MKRLLVHPVRHLFPVAFAFLLLAACGSDAGDTSAGGESSTTSTTTTIADDSTTTSVAPADPQRIALEDARALWSVTRPATYEFEYFLGCECDGGPWRVRVDENGVGTAEHLFGGFADAPYRSIDDIFDEIEATLDAGEIPVRVEYENDFGYPANYIWNEPELPVDGGFIVEVTSFVPNPADADGAQADELAAARALWDAAGIDDYEYTFTRTCFCPEEFRGPYKVSVRDGKVESATFEGTDVLEIELLGLTRYEELILTVDAVFDEVERGLSAEALTVEYDPELGHPTNVFIDLAFNMADEEIGYTIENLRSAPSDLDTCSTTGVEISLEAQPDLPAPVAETRRAIFEAAMACDIDALVALIDAEGFNASFGGGAPGAIWRDGETVFDAAPLLGMVQHLNLAYTEFGDGGDITGYTWPSAFLELEAPDGAGLPPEEFAELLTVYTPQQIDEMFEFIGGYAGYRLGIEPNGDWIFFVAGD